MSGHIKIENLSKIYQVRQHKGFFNVAKKEVVALKNLSLEIKPGEIFGLLGPNGTGKTTLIKCLVTLLIPTSGTAWVNGYRLGEEDNQIRATVGCMLMGTRGLYWKLTGRENLFFFGALYHLTSSERRRRANELIERLNLGDIADRPVESYSSGQKMKLAFAKSLINNAPLLILDEPTNALDLPSAREMRALVRELNAEGKTVIYTTHIMAEAEAICERVAIIDHGEVLALGTVSELKASLQREKIWCVEGVISSEATDAVQRLPGVTRVATTTVSSFTQLTVVTNQPRAILHLINTLNTYNTLILQIRPEKATLEDVFMAYTGRTLAEDTRVK